MFILFILILVVGIGGFVYVFTNALKTRDVPEPVSLRSMDRPSPPAAPVAAASSAEPRPMPLDSIEDESAHIIEFKAIRQADELKIMKLEQMIDEKNKVLTDLQQSVKSAHDHEAQIEDLKQIFQAQIEDLKQQNRQLKNEVSRLSEDNLDLQTKIYAGQASVDHATERMEIRPAASTGPAQQSPLEPAPEQAQGSAQQGAQGPASSLSLHDVFGGEEESNKN